jgi:hypothetical protein
VNRLWGLFALVIVPLLLSEFTDWCPWVAARLLKLAARLLRQPYRDRYREEWLAELDKVPGKLSKLAMAASILLRSPWMSHVLRKRVERTKPAPSETKDRHNVTSLPSQRVTSASELRRRLAALRVLSEAIQLRDGSDDDDVDRLVHLLVRELHDLEELEAAMLGAGRRDLREEVDVLEVANAAAQTVGLARRSDITVQGSKRPLRVLTNPTVMMSPW